MKEQQITRINKTFTYEIHKKSGKTRTNEEEKKNEQRDTTSEDDDDDDDKATKFFFFISFKEV